jgi:hypothetical protein
MPPLDTFVLDHLSATPIAGDIDALDDEARKKIGASVMEQVRQYADADGITYPEDTCVLTARAG